MISPDTLLSIADAAAEKRVHYETVRRAIARGDLRATKVGGGVVIFAADLAEWHPTPGRRRPQWEQLSLL